MEHEEPEEAERPNLDKFKATLGAGGATSSKSSTTRYVVLGVVVLLVVVLAWLWLDPVAPPPTLP